MAEDGQKSYSAKQVASRIGTDAKQLRKFFRDEKSGYTPVGQGGRYDFPEDQLPIIKQAFDAWNSTKTRRNRQPQPKTPTTASGLIPAQRKESPRVRRNNKEGLHGNALDEDNLHDRMQGIAARVRKHNLTVKQGRFVPGPEIDDIPGLRESLPAGHPEGLTHDQEGASNDHAEPQILDFTEVDEDSSSSGDGVHDPSHDEILALMDELSLEEEAYPELVADDDDLEIVADDDDLDL